MVGRFFGGVFGGKGPRKQEPNSAEQSPEQTERLIKALEQLAGGDTDAAIAELDAAVANDPLDWMSLQNRGSFHLHAGHPEQAVADLSEVLRLNPKNALAHFTRGKAYCEMLDFERAEEDFTSVIVVRSGIPGTVAEAHLRRGVIHHEAGLMEKAYDDYCAAIRIDASLSEKPEGLGEAYARRGTIFMLAEEYAHAMDDFAVALERNPADAVVRGHVGVVCINANLYEEAIQLDIAIELQPSEVAYYRNRGGAKLAAGQYEDAVSDLTTAIEMGPPNAPAYANRANARRQLGDLEGALDDYHSGLTLDPTDAVAYAGRAIVLRRLDRIEESDRDVELAIENGYDSAQLAQVIAENTLALALGETTCDRWMGWGGPHD